MSAANPAESEMAAVAAAVLGQGISINRLSLPLTIASLLGTVSLALLTGHSRVLVILLIGAAALAGLVELWFSGRVATDARLFRRMSAEVVGPDWEALDAALIGLGLLPEAKAGRPAGPSIAGAFRLLRYQAAALIVQFALVFAGAAAGACDDRVRAGMRARAPARDRRVVAILARK